MAVGTQLGEAEAPSPPPQVAALTNQQLCGNIFFCAVEEALPRSGLFHKSSRASITRLCFALLTSAAEVLLLGKELRGEQNLAFP